MRRAGAPFYFAWGCFRNFVSSCCTPPTGAPGAPRPAQLPEHDGSSRSVPDEDLRHRLTVAPWCASDYQRRRATTAPQIPAIVALASTAPSHIASSTRTRSRKHRTDRLRCTASLRRCNQKAPLCMMALRAALSTSREVYCGIFCDWKTIVLQIPAMAPVLSKTENGWI